MEDGGSISPHVCLELSIGLRLSECTEGALDEALECGCGYKALDVLDGIDHREDVEVGGEHVGVNSRGIEGVVRGDLDASACENSWSVRPQRR